MTTSSLSFRFSGKIARLLGRESVSSEIVALFELVKNSYDADASQVELLFENTNKVGGTIRVKDDGDGMTFDDISNKWMVVGTESKERSTQTRKGRRVVGEKGVGRFSTEKLARRVTLISNPRGAKERIILKINWDEYEKEGARFDEIKNPVTVEPKKRQEEHGLEIILEDLRDRWSDRKLRQLKSEIGTLVLPAPLAGKDQDFRVTITAPEFDIENKPVESSILEKAPFRMIATTSGQNLHCVIYDGKKRYEREPHQFKRKPLCGPISFQLYVFPQDAAGESKWTEYYEDVLKGMAISELLEEHSGVRVYRDGFWVKPYGGKGNDWLELDKMRVARRSRVGNNQVIGFVKISRDKNPEIKDTTTREKLIENEAFDDMKAILTQSVKEFNSFREEVRVKQKELEPTASKDKLAENSIEYAKKIVQQLDIPKQTRRELESALANASRNVKGFSVSKAEELDEKTVALESQSSLVTIGLATSYIAHEVIKPLGDNIAILSRLSSQDSKVPEYTHIKAEIERLKLNTAKLHHFMSFVDLYTQMISSSIDEHWARNDVRITDVWRRLENGFDEVLKELDISVFFKQTPDNIVLSINPVDLESILTNLLTNSIKALKRVKENRMIKVECSFDVDNFILRFSDSGPGVEPSARERIFEPLFSTYKAGSGKTHGTGLGLPIIRTILNKYEGSIELMLEGEYKPGATFLVRIPLAKAPRVVS